MSNKATITANDVFGTAFYYNDKFEKKQWYLDGSIQDSALSIDVFSVWKDYSGAGVKVGVIDSQIDFNHTDLKGAYDASLDYNFTLGTDAVVIDSANLPYFHGTAVAGVISAQPDNAVGTVGIASGATLVGYGVDYGADTVVTDILAALRSAASLDVVNNSWSFSSNLADNFAANPEYEAALLSSVSEGRGGLGTSIVFAAGNAGFSGTSNYHNFQNSPYTIAVGAVDPDGNASSFTSLGANVLISAAGRDVFTTALKDGYGSYSGTSFAAPAVSAAIALMLEANPELGYRDVQEILAYSAHREALADTNYMGDGWLTNGANNLNGGGLHFNEAYGYGFLNVHDAVRLAETWTDQQTYDNLSQVTKTVTPGVTLVAGSRDTISVAIDVEETLSVEHVQLSMDFRWLETGNLDVYLVSPEGTQVRLMYDLPGVDRIGNIRNFTFDSVASMGELSAGTWTLQIVNRNPGATDKAGVPLSAEVRSVTLTVLGDATDTNDDVYIYTDEFGMIYEGAELAQRQQLADTDGGNDTLNAAAITSNSTIDLSGATGTSLAGVVLNLKAGIENVYTGDGNDTIRGSVSANVIAAGRGDDTIYFSFGDDRIDGGTGNDTLIIDAKLGSLVIGLTANGALEISARSGEVSQVLGVETFILRDGSFSLADVTAVAGTQPVVEDDEPAAIEEDTGTTQTTEEPADLDETTDTGNSDSTSEETSEETSEADQGSETQEDTFAHHFYGTDGIDKLVGTSEADYIDGGAESDYLDGGAGDDLILGGYGEDALIGDIGNDTLDGGEGMDKLYGGDGADTIYGGNGRDLIKGDNGDDWIVSGSGADRVFGGAGADTFVFNLSDLDEFDTIYDFNASEGDRILVTSLDGSDLSGAQFTFVDMSTSVLVQLVHNDTIYDIARIKGEGVTDLQVSETDLGLLCA